MRPLPTVSARWLARRADADADARSPDLARELARLLKPGKLRMHDVGSGTGAMATWLAPRLHGPQHWVLHDQDARILAGVDLRSAADNAGTPVTSSFSVEALADLTPKHLAHADAVSASALLDVITHTEAERIVAGCVAAGSPALLSLSVSGGVRLHPADMLDTELGTAFNDHQGRDAGGRRLLGPGAVRVVAGLFTAAEWSVHTACTPWHLGPARTALIHDWLDGWVDAAVEQRPALAAAAEDYRRRRHEQAAAQVLRVTVGHEDLLAWPS